MSSSVTPTSAPICTMGSCASVPAMMPCTVAAPNTKKLEKWMPCHTLRGSHFIPHDVTWMTTST